MPFPILRRAAIARVFGALALLAPAAAATAAPLVPDSDGDLTAGAVGPANVATTFDTPAEAVDVFDFVLSDGGTSDALPLDVTEVSLHAAGSMSDADRSKLTLQLDGVTGSYDAPSQTYTFSGLTISVADGANATYTVSAYWSSSAGLADGATLTLSVDGGADLVVDAAGTQMGTTTPVANTATVAVEATALAVTTQPAGSVSGVALTTQPVVTAQDAFGNTDLDFAETVTLTEGSAGALSGDVDVAAVSGVATFADVAYTASADQEAFTLTANDQDGTGTNLPTVDAAAVTSDVVATRLAFSTEPAPTTVASGVATAFTTVPAVRAVDAAGTVDVGYTAAVTLAEVNGAGTATMDATGDADGDGATVSLAASSGVATFTGLQITYTASGGSDETFNLQASSGGLATADSAPLTAVTNPAPVFAEGGTASLTSVEDGPTLGLDDVLAASDDAGETLTWTVKTAPSTGTLSGFPMSLAATGTGTPVTPTGLAYTAAPDANGTDTFVIEVGDGTSTAEMTVTIIRTAVNDAPSFVAGPDQVVAKNAGPQTVVGWATAISGGPADESQDVHFHTSSDAPFSFAQPPYVDPAGTLTFEPAPNATGVATVSLYLHEDYWGGDGNDESPMQTFTISVGMSAGSPTITELPAFSILEDESSQPLAFSIGADVTATSDLVVRAASSDTTLIAASGLALAGSGSERTLTITPVADAHGIAQVTVTVSDGSDQASTTFTVVVQPVADAPRYAAGAPAPTAGRDGGTVTLSPDSSQTVRVEWPAATDVDGGAAFQYTWELAADSTFGSLLAVMDASASPDSTEATAARVAEELLRLDVPVGVFAAAYDALALPMGTPATLYHRVRATAGERTATTPAAVLTVVPAMSTASEGPALPEALTLGGNYPNPVGRSTRIRYAVPTAAPVRLEVFDTLGRRVQVLVDGPQAAGWHDVTLDAGALQSGTYLYRVVSNGAAATGSLVVLK